jgi:Ca-activated chloride channel family protein
VKKLEAQNTSGAMASLIVFTDGKNDVRSGDDPGLLGDHELPKVIARIKEANVQVFAIGFGTPGQNFDENTLRQIAFPDARNYFGAADANRLHQVVATISARNKTFVRLLVAMPERREQLPQTVEFHVKTGSLSATSRWERPAMGEPPRVNLTTDERPDVGQILDAGPPPVPAVVIRMIVFVTYAAVLAGMWFGLPRVIWPERYIPKPALQAAAARPGPRPSAGRVASHAVPGQRQPAPRPEVTLPANRPPMRPAQGGDRRGSPPPPPSRVREAPRAAEPPPEPLGPREAGDATVFIPPKKK